MRLPKRIVLTVAAGAVATAGLAAAPLHAFAGSGGSAWCFNNDPSNQDTPLVNGVPIPGTTYDLWLGIEDGVPQGFPGHLAVCWDLGSTPPNVAGPVGSELIGGGLFVNVLAPYNGPYTVDTGTQMDPEAQPINGLLNYFAYVNVPAVTANYDGPCTVGVCLPLTNQSWISVSGPIAGVSVAGVTENVNAPGCVYNSDATNRCQTVTNPVP
jgi:hypothetical protein